jgi:hypothetical protein
VAVTAQTRLAATHQQAQAALAARLAAILAARWRTLVSRPGVGGDEYLERAVRDIRGQYGASVILARSFYATSRRLGAPSAGAFTPTAPEFDDEATIVSLVAAGFDYLRDQLEAGNDLATALEAAGDSAARAGVRRALSGGRTLIVDGTERDRAAVGFYWQTVGDDRVCSWCAMLSSRGAVFKEDSWASDPRPDGRRKVSAHDNCRCHVAPVWDPAQELPDGVLDLSADWDDVRATGPGSSLWSGHESIKAWRRFWEALQRGEDRATALEHAADGRREGNWARRLAS